MDSWNVFEVRQKLDFEMKLRHYALFFCLFGSLIPLLKDLLLLLMLYMPSRHFVEHFFVSRFSHRLNPRADLLMIFMFVGLFKRLLSSVICDLFLTISCWLKVGRHGKSSHKEAGNHAHTRSYLTLTSVFKNPRLRLDT
ncbi:hypothetical protein L2E82_01044 [Cichorium intybus]|uniref:Uncharacterized protein n=1 Tax=Cichorium intybus TaxID=13427 RepID=A0ACB9GXW5_CICIN|nr:hypothetical protein L2E82_01044 [Cichorium intybus]